MATDSNIIAWNIAWTEESGGLQSMGSQSDTTEHKAQNFSNILESNSWARIK